MSSTLLRLIGRGALAGTVAGLLSGGVSLLLGRPSVDAAIAMEEATADTGVEVFSRAEQGVGLLVTSMITGLAVGVLFGAIYAAFHRGDDGDGWRRSLVLAAAGFVGVALIPFLRYPANPPGVGDPGTVSSRTSAYLLAVLIGVAAVTAAALLHEALQGRERAVRQLAATAVVLAGVGITRLLPPPTLATGLPPELIWDFRLASIATLATLWFGLGTAFGLIAERAAQREEGGRPRRKRPA
jgi:predicted cobalt transporter CbtA